MPQMAPMNWILMFLTFIITLMMIISIIHSFSLVDPSKEIIDIKKPQINWKW